MKDLGSRIVPFDPSEQWPEPDMSIGEPSCPPAPQMNDADFAHVFGPWAGWLKQAAETKGAPVDYVAIALLTTASAAIGNSRWAVPWQGWKEPSVLWGMLVGDPSAGKSPALDAVMDAVKEIERELAEAYKASRSEWENADEIARLALAAWKTDAKAAMADGGDAPAKPEGADAGRPPIRERISISDATTEKVAELLTCSWRGLLLARDELSGWLGSMDRYNGGGDRPFWLEAYGGRSFTVDRKSSPEPIIVDHLSVSVIGGTQPDKLESLLMKSDDDGLLARFLTVFPDPVPLSRPRTEIDQARLVQALKRLRNLAPATDEHGNRHPFFVYLTDPAADALQEFRQQCREWETDAAGLFKSHIGKLPGLAVRVACVLAHLDWAAHADGEHVSQIGADHIGRACHLVGRHLRSHALRAYGTASLPAEVEAAKSIAHVIRAEHLQRFKLRDIQNRNRTGLKKASEVKAALNVLMDADWVREITEKSGGRPTITYVTNPKLEALL